MTDVRVTGRDGVEKTLAATDGIPLMETLRDGDTGVAGTCGGACSCGSCHVYVDAEWIARLPPKNDDEIMMLEAIGEFVELKSTSRLSCQIPMSSALAGLAVTIAPEV